MSFGRSSGLDVILVNFILAPQRGQRRGAGVCSLTFSTTSGFTRAWLSRRGVNGSMSNFSITFSLSARIGVFFILRAIATT